MDTEVAEPLREPLQFEVDTENLSIPEAQVVSNIKRVAEHLLYSWKTFPIVLPPPVAVLTPETDSPNQKPRPLNLRDVFITPSFDELESVSLDAKGEPKRLTEKQLQSIYETGEFEVESLNFQGQVHRWQLSYLLQKGKSKTRQCLMQDFALALRLLVVTARNRLTAEFFSVSQSVKALWEGLLRLLDIFFGVPSLSTKNLDARVREERSKYLVAELTVRPNLEDDLDNLCQFVRHQIHKHTMEKYRIESEKPPPVPCIYQTPQEKDIDLRLMNKVLIRRCLPFLASILEKEARNWFLPFREKILADLKTKKLSEDEMERQANVAVTDEYIRRVFASINECQEIDAIEPGFGTLLVEQAHGVILMHRAVDNVQNRLDVELLKIKSGLGETYPILSLIRPWLTEKLQQAKEHFMHENQWEAHRESLELCRQRKLQQTIYFLHRDLAFMREREPVLKQELGKVRNPNRVYRWRTQIWLPGHWKVRRVFRGKVDALPTMISKGSSSLAQPRSDPNQPVYLVEKQCTRTTSTQWPFWRWINYFYRTWSWTWNAMFLFGVVIPWCSPISLRALFSLRPFMPDLELSQIDGILYPKKTSLTHTLCSRLFKLWRHISKSRTEFESSPDTGFIGKGFSRHLNRLWNYVAKGVLGTLTIILAFPIVCLLASTLSIFVAVLAPLWIPVSTFFFHLCTVFVYDFDSPERSRNKISVVMESLVWCIFILGILQPVLAVVVALTLCPAAVFVALFGLLRCGLRRAWDSTIFHLVIRKRGRIPAADSWLVRRIAGPGLSDTHFYKIEPEQALASVEARLEVEELNAFKEEVEVVIQQPQNAFSDFVRKCLEPFSAGLVKEGTYLKLEKQTQELLAMLKDQVDRRKRELHTGLNVATRSRVKMNMNDLQLTIRQTSLFLEKFCPEHVFARLSTPEQNFWEDRGLVYHDWPGLAAQMLSEVFSSEILTPLEDSDTFYQLESEVAKVPLTRYKTMVREAENRLDIDVSNTIHTPKGNVRVHAPYLDLNTFNPLGSPRTTVCKPERRRFRYPWKQKREEPRWEKLVIPLAIPHPAEIAVIIFNRENEEPVPLEAGVCHEVIKAIQDGCRNSTIATYDPSDGSPPDSHSLATTGGNPDLGDPPTPDSEERLSQTTCSRHTSGSIVVNLASIEDISIEAGGQRVTYNHSSYSTTV